MEVQLQFASDVVDKFEELLCENNISIPRHPQTEADMLPFWEILNLIKGGFSGAPDKLRSDYTAAVAVHDLAAKLLEVSSHQQFKDLLPHLELLADGAVHLTEDPPAYSDVYNKLIEIYWASLCLASGLRVELDDPKNSDGTNPDVITLDIEGNGLHAYAFKTVRSPHTQNIFEHICKGVDQIEKSKSVDGIVVLHLTPRLQTANIWPSDHYFSSWTHPAIYASATMQTMINQVVVDNGLQAIKDLFENKKSVGAVLCIAFCPTVAAHPVTGKPTVMPLKVPILVDLGIEKGPSQSFFDEINQINHEMQVVLG